MSSDISVLQEALTKATGRAQLSNERRDMVIRGSIVGTFLCVTVGTWVWIKPPSEAPAAAFLAPLTSPAQTPQVERPVLAGLVAQPQSVAPVVETEAASVAVEAAPVATAAAVEASVTRALTPAPTIDPTPRVSSGAADAARLELVARVVLEGMGFGAEDTALRELAQGALSDIRGVTGVDAETDSAFGEMVLVGMVTGWDDQTIAETVRTAYEAGEISVPAGVITTTGAIDMPVVLEGLLLRARAAVGEPVPTPVAQATIYTVQPGDSLARIAIEVYGDMAGYGPIMSANPSILSTPDALQPGQILQIPPI